MPKKKDKKHFKFYQDCIKNGKMPRVGLCSCATYDLLSESLLDMFIPDNTIETAFSFWASGIKNKNCMFRFTKLRQTIVLFMACLNNEL